LIKQEIFLISFKQAVCGKFALQFSDEFVGNGSKNIHDSKTLDATITHANSNRTKPIQQAVCDRGYVGVKEALGAMIILPKKAKFALQFSDEFVGNGSKAC
jgi:hypothetical protein